MKQIKIILDEHTADLVARLIDYNKEQLQRAEKLDPYKDNGYLIKACEDFAKAYEEATK